MKTVTVADHSLDSAIREIKYLRSENATLKGQVYVVDVFAAALGMRPTGFGASPDICWELQDALNAAAMKTQNQEELLNE